MDMIAEVVVLKDEEGYINGLQFIATYGDCGGKINDPIEAKRVLSMLKSTGNLLSENN